MARTGLYINWKNWTVTYGSGPTTISLTQVTDVQVQRGDQWVSFKADGNVFATAMALANSGRAIRITGGDIGKLLTIPRNTPCTVAGYLWDQKNQSNTGSGTLSISLANACFEGNAPGGGQNQFITDTVQFTGYSSDGTTDPLTITEAP